MATTGINYKDRLQVARLGWGQTFNFKVPLQSVNFYRNRNWSLVTVPILVLRTKLMLKINERKWMNAQNDYTSLQVRFFSEDFMWFILLSLRNQPDNFEV